MTSSYDKATAAAIADAKADNSDDDGHTLHAPQTGWAWCGARSTRFAPAPKDVNCRGCLAKMAEWRRAGL